MLNIDHKHLTCKVALHYCRQIYNISFVKDCNDYYGRDIDLTYRMMSKALPNRIVLSEAYYLKVLEDMDRQGLSRESGFVSKITDKYIEDFKGVPEPTEFRLLKLRSERRKHVR